MKVVLFNTYNKSFLSDFFVEFSGMLSNFGHEVCIVSLKGRASELKLDTGVTVKILKKGNKLGNLIKIYKIIKESRPDVVISNFSLSNPAILAAKLLGIKHNILWFHTLKAQMNFSPQSIFIKSLFMNMTTAIITNSFELKEEVASAYRQKGSKIHALPFTTSILNYEKQVLPIVKEAGKIYVGCPGRLHPDKNQGILVDMLNGAKHRGLVLCLAGKIDEDIVRKHPLYNNYKDQILYLGNLNREEMVGFYEQMDVIVLPSFNESFGLVFIEAIALGANTLVSNRFGALGFVYDDFSRIVFDPQNSSDLIEKLDNVINDPLPKSYFVTLYQHHFSLEEIIRKFISIIK